MHNISLWASRHRRTTQLLIIALYFPIHVLGVFIGSAMENLGVNIPIYWMYILAVPFFYAWCTYPERRQSTYHARKIKDAALIAISFFLVVCINNQPVHNFSSVQSAWSSPSEASMKPAAATKPSTQKPLSLKKKLRKKLRENILELRRQYRDASTGEKVALIILSVLLALVLLYLVAALSCSIACAGSEGLAIFVLLLGTGLIIFLFVRVIRSINRKHRRQMKVAPQGG